MWKNVRLRYRAPCTRIAVYHVQYANTECIVVFDHALSVATIVDFSKFVLPLEPFH